MKYTIKVSFHAEIFGTFRQSVIFSFGFEPHLRQDLCVDVVPVLDAEETKIQQLQETLIKQAERYILYLINILVQLLGQDPQS
jgi:hypothetical protein